MAPDPTDLVAVARAVDAQHQWYGVEVGTPAGPRWVPGRDWLAPDGARLEAQVREVAEARQGGADLGAVFLAGWYARAVVLPVVGAWCLTGRVPLLTTDRLRVRSVPGGWFDRFALAPDTPLLGPAGPGGAGPDDLRAAVGTVVVAHLGPFVEALRARVAIGRRALWGAVTDAMGSAFLVAGDTLGRPLALAEEADRVFAAAPPELAPRPRWVVVDHGGRAHVFMRRPTCCLAFKSPLHDWCATCPLISEEERLRQLRASLAN